jgi:hypothetical protein
MVMMARYKQSCCACVKMETAANARNVFSDFVFLLRFASLGMWLFLQDKGSSGEASLNYSQGCHEVCRHIHEGTKTRGSTLSIGSHDFWHSETCSMQFGHVHKRTDCLLRCVSFSYDGSCKLLDASRWTDW